jgi:hypothetical protein
VVQDLSRDERLSEQARTNTIEQFKYAFDPKAIEAFIKLMERNDKMIDLCLLQSISESVTKRVKTFFPM